METTKPTPPSDEIDLGQLFSKIGKFFLNIGLEMVRFIAFLRNVPLRHKTLFAVLIVVGAGMGFLYSTLIKKKFYQSTMILSSDYMNKRIVDNTIEKLNLLALEEDPKGLANVLSISDSLAGNIVKFEAKPFISEKDLIELEVLKEQLKNAQVNNKNEKVVEQVLQRIEIENRHAFEITVRTFSPTVIKPMQDALVSFFRNKSNVGKRIEITKTNLLARKKKLQRESQKLDSLKKVIYTNYRTMAEQSRQGSNNVILSDKSVTNPIDVYNQDMNLYAQLESVERQLFIQPDFELVDGFTEFSEPASDSRTKTMAYAVLIAFCLGYVIVGLRKLDKHLASYK
ncbi:MAG: hypothetical protein JST48_03975 [Bacteroidetes bacterium]|nr:hypothetical protein [Bacteroidota bacterium]